MTPEQRFHSEFPQLAIRLGKAVGRFAASGFVTTSPETLASREATCRSCDQWDGEALRGSGRCRVCGCATWAKLRMASEKCPIEKWGEEVAKAEARVEGRETSVEG